jgi:hypothetical protein
MEVYLKPLRAGGETTRVLSAVPYSTGPIYLKWQSSESLEIDYKNADVLYQVVKCCGGIKISMGGN